MDCLSTLNSTWPDLIVLISGASSKVTVPTFGLGIKPRGPRIFPILPTTLIISGVATTLSKSSHPSWIFLERSSPPTKSAPASCASCIFSPLAKTRTRTSFPSPWGRAQVPRTIWSALRGSTPSLIESSTVSSNFVALTDLIRSIASSRL